MKNPFERKQKGAVAILCVLCVLFFMAAGCGKQRSAFNAEDENEQNLVSASKDNELVDDESEGDQLTSLKGTVWKLVGIVGRESANNPTGALRELGPIDCEDCYTMWFDTDYTATAIGIQKRFKLDLRNLNSPVLLDDMLRCEEYDKDGESYCDNDDFYRAILTTGSWSATDDELTLFQHYRGQNGEDLISTHLLFKSVDRDPPTTLRGTKWKLTGIFDVQTGELTEFEPADCSECYTLSFRGDYKLSAKSIWAIQFLDLLNLDLEQDPTQPGYWANPYLLYAEKWDEYYGGDGKTYEDSWIYRCGIAYSKSYKLTPDGELKLFFVYQEKEYYLTFKLVFK